MWFEGGCTKYRQQQCPLWVWASFYMVNNKSNFSAWSNNLKSSQCIKMVLNTLQALDCFSQRTMMLTLNSGFAPDDKSPDALCVLTVSSEQFHCPTVSSGVGQVLLTPGMGNWHSFLLEALAILLPEVTHLFQLLQPVASTGDKGWWSCFDLQPLWKAILF